MYRYIDRFRCFYLYFQLKNHQFENPLPRNFEHPCLRVDAKRVKNALSFVPIVTGFSGTSALGWLLLPFRAFWGQLRYCALIDFGTSRSGSFLHIAI